MSNSSPSQWPPRSPHEALLSSPSGRERLRQLQDRTSPSPSPAKGRINSLGRSSGIPKSLLEDDLEGDDSEEDDEETLKLKLEAIEARLKLKRLRQAKIQKEGQSPKKANGKGKAQSGESAQLASAQPTAPGRREGSDVVQVPFSPPKRKREHEEQRSPSRILLGIDKGLRGRDVSLRRAPSSFLIEASLKIQGQGNGIANRRGSKSSLPAEDGSKKPQSFSERLAESRTAERARQERQDQNRKSRSSGFGVEQKQIEELKAQSASGSLEDPFLAEARNGAIKEFSRSEVLQSVNQQIPASLRRTRSEGIPRPTATSIAEQAKGFKAPGVPDGGRSASAQDEKSSTHTIDENEGPKSQGNDVVNSQFESFSGFHLSSRTMPHNFIARTLSGKHLMSIPKLLRDIKAPDFDSPDIEGDWVVLGIIAAKSSPLNHKEAQSKGEDKRGKFMVLTLTDLKWEVELFLFSTAFDRFWKLDPGTVIAILNPAVMPPPPNRRDTGKFSLTLHSSDDTVLEIGVARDLGFCKSVKKDGKACSAWVDKRHTDHCAFHVDLSVKKTMASRMEVNTMGKLFGPESKGSKGRGGLRGSQDSRSTNWKNRSGQQDGETGGRFFLSSGAAGSGRSTSNLLDDEDVDPDIFHRGSTKQERLRRRLAEREREKAIAKRLGDSGNGMGKEYLRASGKEDSEKNEDGSAADSTLSQSVDAASLGFSMGTADTVSLSPVKRKRGQSSMSSSAGSAVGWGSALKRGLPSSIMGKKSQEHHPPERKKTRFVTEKGIREAGRESFGKTSSDGTRAGTAGDDDDDDDELDIV